MSAKRKTTKSPEAKKTAPTNDPAGPPKYGIRDKSGKVSLDTEGMTRAEIDEQQRRTFGTADKDLHLRLLSQGGSTVEEATNRPAVACNLTAAALHGIAPRDTLEGLLGTQMVGAHNLAMHFLHRAAHPEQTYEARLGYTNAANKLLRTYAAQVEALAKYRGKGEQKVEVKHVHVHEGGQAIVGNVNHGGGGVPNGNERTTPSTADLRRQDAEGNPLQMCACGHPGGVAGCTGRRAPVRRGATGTPGSTGSDPPRRLRKGGFSWRCWQRQRRRCDSLEKRDKRLLTLLACRI